jgi:hypothetical protein
MNDNKTKFYLSIIKNTSNTNIHKHAEYQQTKEEMPVKYKTASKCHLDGAQVDNPSRK